MRSGTRCFQLSATCLMLMLGLLVPTVSSAQHWGSPLVIPAVEFVNNGQSLGEFNFVTAGGYLSGVGNEVVMLAPVQLPNGVTIQRFEAAMADGGDGCMPDDVHVVLFRNTLDGDTASWMATTETTYNSLNEMQIIEDSTIFRPVVDNLQYTYFVQVSFCNILHGFQAVRIFYTE